MNCTHQHRRIIAPCIIASLMVLPVFSTARADEPLQFGAYKSTIADLADPVAVAIGVDDQIYIVERDAHRIRVFDRTGRQQLEFGAYGDGPGQLDSPGAIAVAPDGGVLVADDGNCRVQIFDQHGKARGTIGEYGFDDGQFRGPLGIAVDAEHVYVADSAAACIQVFSHAGVHQRTIRSDPTAAVKLIRPVAVTVTGDGTIAVADAYASRIFAFRPDGAPGRVFGEWGYFPGMLAEPVGIAYRDQRYYVADNRNHRVQVFDLAGKLQYQWGLHAIRPREGEGKLHYPNAVAIAPDGKFAVVCETFENRCQIFELETAAAAAQRFNPLPPGSVGGASHFGRRIDIDGDLMALVEPDSHSVMIYDIMQPTPILIHKFGGQGMMPGQFNFPTDVCLERERNRLTVIDAGNRRIQVFSLARPTGDLKYLPDMTRLTKAIDLIRVGGKVSALGDHQTFVATAIDRDADGKLFVLDAVNELVVVLDEDAAFQRSWGGHGRGHGEFRDPTDLLISPDGETVYVVDADNQRVQMFDRQGKPRGAFGQRGDSYKQFHRPFSIAFAGEGAVFVSDPSAERIHEYRPDGEFVRSWGRYGLGPSEFHLPSGLAGDAKGRLFVIDFGNHRGQVFQKSGAFENAFGARLFVDPALRPKP